MMTASKALIAAWDAASADAGVTPGYYHRRIQLRLSQPAYAGVVVPGRIRRLSFDFEEVSLQGLNLKDHTRGYLVETEKHSSPERIFIHLQETPSGMPKDLFRVFCSDVLQHIAPCGNATETARTLHSRLGHWKRFFQSRSPEGLSRDEYIGIFAEIEFFKRCLEHGVAHQILSDAWQGPLGTNQDFLFGHVAVEVKAVTANDAGFLHISNIRQLDDTGLNGLFLSHIAYDFRDGAGNRLLSLIQSVRSLLAATPDALATFDDRLLAAGYTEPDPSPFASFGFTERQRSYFKVCEGFPRILESALAPGISDVDYSVNLAACTGFAMSEIDILNSLLP
ncbi:MAG TPA: PD-(D/E)XK motif protein [Nitrospiraceae bacterium]|jgi:hypothetical protein|nr:PD-(D/E)XK motif protein [Nitrospiraceae bacterium]